MKAHEFISALDHQRIDAAIAAAEQATSGQLRVFITHAEVDDALAAARKKFAQLGLQKTAARNAILLFLAPSSRKYAIVGDEGIHAKCGGDEFWQSVIGTTMAPPLQEGRFTDAIVAGIAAAGAELARHFPPEAGAHGSANELPGDVLED